MNEALKGFRGLILGVLAVISGNIEVVNDLVQTIATLVGSELSDGGAVAALLAFVTAVKLAITDAFPKLTGTLNK